MIDPQKIFSFSPESKKINENNELLVEWSVPENLPYFEGHFPENPILPGVAILDLLSVLLEGKFSSIKSVKFTEVVRPLDTITIKAKKDSESSSWSVHITKPGDVIVCKASFVIA